MINEHEKQKALLKIDIDKNTSARDLPFNIFGTRNILKILPYNENYFNVYDIKGHTIETDIHGKPKMLCTKSITPKAFLDLLMVLNFYDQYIERLINNTNLYKYNGEKLFYEEKLKKLELVKENKKNIIDYLFISSKNNNFIFGKVNNIEKESIYEASCDNSNKYYNSMLDKTLEVIANYTTEEELFFYPENLKILSKFIIKK